ncbi:MAG: DUF3105 domain-containing protein [Chloroflexi bacterium]|nr:DUF3105 domain-containing protein [Chloroflexota bacterium]
MTRAAANEPQQRRDRRQTARTDRKKIEAQRERRRKLSRMGGWAVVGLVVAGVLGWFVYITFLKEYPGQLMADLGNRHVTATDEVTYNSEPPTSGPHLPNLASWGVHSEPVDTKLQVHNLEDGGVVVQYDCEDCQDMVKQLETIVLPLLV